jgi:cytochrome c peroxidase
MILAARQGRLARLFGRMVLAGFVACERSAQGPKAAVSATAGTAVTAAQTVLPRPASTPAVATGMPGFYGTVFARSPSARELSALGRKAFFDTRLSASGRLACASCHDPAHDYGPPDGRAVRLGGGDGRQPGLRTVPSLRYRQTTPAFTEHYQEDDGNDSEDQGPVGGRDWDGRADSAHEQAAGPLLSPFEMANATPGAVIAALRRSGTGAAFRTAFGADVFDDDQRGWKALLWALEVFQQEPAEFYPYRSRYDDVLRGTASLTPREAHGLAIFEDPQRGNCAACHPSGRRGGALPQFTDYSFVAIGLPRNSHIPANRDTAWFDLGLCGPLRGDFRGRAEYCGLFKTPSLRNAARRRVFFHNGITHSLRDAIRFYAERDVVPGRWYPRRPDGTVRVFDDLPVSYRDNLNQDAPFGPTADGKPRLDAQDIDDLVAFITTLNDAPVKPGMSGQ